MMSALVTRSGDMTHLSAGCGRRGWGAEAGIRPVCLGRGRRALTHPRCWRGGAGEAGPRRMRCLSLTRSPRCQGSCALQSAKITNCSDKRLFGDCTQGRQLTPTLFLDGVQGVNEASGDKPLVPVRPQHPAPLGVILKQDAFMRSFSQV